MECIIRRQKCIATFWQSLVLPEKPTRVSRSSPSYHDLHPSAFFRSYFLWIRTALVANSPIIVANSLIAARNMYHLTRLERFLGTSAWLAISATIASGDFNRCCEKRGGHTCIAVAHSLQSNTPSSPSRSWRPNHSIHSRN